MATQINIQNLDSFLKSVQDAGKIAKDLSVPLGQIARDWMRTNKTIFALSGPGPFKDLSGTRAARDKRGRFQSKNGGYKGQKLKKWGFVYPILKASGKLERSLTEPSDPNALFEIINGETLILGTRVMGKNGANYPAFLNAGTRKMPARRYLSIPELSVSRWVTILRTYMVGKMAASRPLTKSRS